MSRRLEFRAHVAITVSDSTTDREAEKIAGGFLDHAREANGASDGDYNFTVELDEDSPDEVDP